MAIVLADELIELRRELLDMAGLTERQLADSITALRGKDIEAALEVRRQDEQVNEFEVAVEARCLRILALGSPIGADLRNVLASLRVSNNLERIGDLAKGVSKKTVYLVKQGVYEVPDMINTMAEESAALLSRAVQCLATEQPYSLERARQADARVDDCERMVFRWVEETAPQSPEMTAVAVDFYSIARRLERIADLSVNIIEEVNFLVEGRIVRHGIEVQPGEVPTSR